MREQDHAVARLWEHSAEFLLARSGHPPSTPKDWRQEAKLSCACADCRELQAFTLEPGGADASLPGAEGSPPTLARAIKHHNLDMTHAAERPGSPQTLVCTKDCRSYRRRIAALAVPAKLAGKTSAAAALLEKIQAARTLAAVSSPA